MTRQSLLSALEPLLNAPPDDPSLSYDARRVRMGDRLYHECHCRDTPGNATRAYGRDLALERRYRAALASANAGDGHWQDGWTVRGESEEGKTPVEHDGLTLWALADDIRGTVAPGQQVSVRFPSEYRNLYWGFYVVLGNADDSRRADKDRFYWNLTPEGGATIVRLVSTILNDARIGFRFKLLADPGRYSRTDAGVLYIPSAETDRALPFIHELYNQMRGLLKPSVSAFVHQLAPGLGAAEDLVSKGSFGIHRAELLAPIMLEAQEQQLTLDQLAGRIAETGYDPDRFYINPRSTREFPSW